VDGNRKRASVAAKHVAARTLRTFCICILYTLRFADLLRFAASCCAHCCAHRRAPHLHCHTFPFRTCLRAPPFLAGLYCLPAGHITAHAFHLHLAADAVRGMLVRQPASPLRAARCAPRIAAYLLRACLACARTCHRFCCVLVSFSLLFCCAAAPLRMLLCAALTFSRRRARAAPPHACTPPLHYHRLFARCTARRHTTPARHYTPLPRLLPSFCHTRTRCFAARTACHTTARLLPQAVAVS